MFDESRLAPQNGVSATVTIKDWLLLDCIGFLNIIPIVGSIVALVLYLVIGFGSTTAVSMKNRVLASLLWFVIWFVLGILFLFVFGGFAAIMTGIDAAARSY